MGALTPRTKQLKTPTGLIYDDESTFQLTEGVYHGFDIMTNLNDVSTIKRIYTDIDGTPKTIITGEQIKAMSTIMDIEQVQGQVSLDLSNFFHRTPRGIFKTALAVGKGENATLTVEFGVKTNDDPDVLQMRGIGHMSPNRSAALPLGGRVFEPFAKSFKLDSPSAGTFAFDYPKGSTQTMVQKMLFDESVVKIEKVRIFYGDNKEQEFYREDIEFLQRKYGDYKPQAGWLLLDFTLLGFGEEDAMSTNGLNFELEVDEVGAINTYVQGFQPAR